MHKRLFLFLQNPTTFLLPKVLLCCQLPSYKLNQRNMKFLNQIEAQNIDVELINDYKYTIEQLMELAGEHKTFYLFLLSFYFFKYIFLNFLFKLFNISFKFWI